ncbi:MAG: AAA family ATPase [Candidatus Edwardsbacteria bacterium]|nr:AAA family ATPase [Candidatus Edwardsbacteria bacterium]
METIIPRLFSPPKFSFFLFGPRGTGKTTLLRQNYPDALWIDLLEPDVFRSYSARPERLREVVLAYPDKRTVVVDEVQKVPELLSLVHSLIEKKMKYQFILTGSSSRKIKRTGVDLLAGRVVKKTLHPFMAAELGGKFDLNEALKRGLLPLVASSQNPDSVLRTYVSLYIKEEVQQEGLVRNIGNFSRFLEAISFSHGARLNISNVARDCEVERKTVEGYLSILEDLLLSFRLPVFAKRAKRAVVSHPKFYFFDSGVYRSLRPSGPLDRPEEIEGGALEGLIAQHLVAWNSYRGEKNNIFYWRTAAGSEVDFVVYGGEVFWAIEIKNVARVRPEDIRPLISFKEDYPESTAYLLYRGKERMMKNGVLCLPCDEFLLRLNPLHKTSSLG